MSDVGRRRTQNREVPRRRRKEEETEDEEEAMDVEEAEEALEDEVDPYEDITGTPSDIAEKLALYLNTNPENEEVRSMAKFYIRKMYIAHGGLPFNKESAIPFDLDPLSSQELVNVLENMVIFTARTTQKDLIGRALNVFTNLGKIFYGQDSEPVLAQVQNDEVLRSSLFEAFLGQKFGPFLTLLITGASHLTNLYLNYKENGKRTTSKRDNTNTASSSASSGVSSNPTNKASV
jgi:hypothetical protein